MFEFLVNGKIKRRKTKINKTPSMDGGYSMKNTLKSPIFKNNAIYTI